MGLRRNLGLMEVVGLSLLMIAPTTAMAFNVTLAVGVAGIAAPLAFAISTVALLIFPRNLWPYLVVIYLMMARCFSCCARPWPGRRFWKLIEDLGYLVRTAGIEPALPTERQILSLLRLPIPPRPHPAHALGLTLGRGAWRCPAPCVSDFPTPPAY